MFAVLASLSARPFPLAKAVDPQKSLQQETVHGCVPIKAAHPSPHLLQQVHWVCENDGTCNLCVTLGV